MKNGARKEAVAVRVHSEVIRAIRQHARSSMSEEICGVLIGTFNGAEVSVRVSIDGANAASGGAHVTFTQDTWEHIYSIKDRDYPDDKILGWYHSHPGFGVFLSEHDTFIHRNFFSAKHQVAWVFDPHSDEEGCFGWNGDRIERLPNFAVVDHRGGELAGKESEGAVSKKRAGDKKDAATPPARVTGIKEEKTPDTLEQFALKFFALLLAATLGFAIAWFVFPRVAVVPVPVDPQTGVPLRYLPPLPSGSPAASGAIEKKGENGTP
jgi:proteasome lid subunit RPN8/RPN11